MKPQSKPQPQQKPKLLSLTAEELERVKRAREKHEAKKVNPEWQFIAEFGYYFGWGGVSAIMDNNIDLDQANQLLMGARKIWYSKVIDYAIGTQTAVASANSKKPGNVMKKGLKTYMKAVES